MTTTCHVAWAETFVVAWALFQYEYVVLQICKFLLKDEMVVLQLSYLYNRNPNAWRDGFYIERGLDVMKQLLFSSHWNDM